MAKKSIKTNNISFYRNPNKMEMLQIAKKNFNVRFNSLQSMSLNHQQFHCVPKPINLDLCKFCTIKCPSSKYITQIIPLSRNQKQKRRVKTEKLETRF